ncbi:conserved repeat protein [Leptolyngbya sp. PCC 7375]|nr:conserved repeat protein [Leptolyngbya sp. PCC 7375]
MKALLEHLKTMTKPVDGQRLSSCAPQFGKKRSGKIALSYTLSLLSAGTLLGAMPQRAEAATYTYDNTSSGAISNTTTSCVSPASPLVRTFTVGDNFTVQDVNLGFNADHAYRGDIQVTLRHPDGTSVQVIASNGSDGSAGYDVLLDSSSANALNDGNADTTATPLYDRTAAPSNSLASFNGKASNGTWTLEVCDTFSSDDGTFNSAQLILDDTAPPIDPSLPTGPRPFSLRYSVETKGNMAAIGNASLRCDTANATCSAALSDGSVGNNVGGLAMQMLDTDSDGSTFNSSSADLTIPAGASVLFAGLYWGGTSNGATTAAPDASKRNEALLATPSSGYQTVTADTYTSIDDSATTGWDVYSSFTDVTSLVQSAGSGTYTMANVQASTGTGFTYPNAGWSLIVVYEDVTEPMRNMTVFDGYNFSGFDTGNVQTLTGLRTPPTAGFDVFMGAFAGDGEPDVTGDTLSINGTAASDAVNPVDNFYNGTISRYGSHVTDRNPNNPYNMVVDIDHLDLTAWNQTNNVIPTNATSIDLNLSTSGDGIWPMVYFFGVEVFEPNLVTQFEKTTPATNYATGDTIPYTISVTNTGNDNSVNTVITDAIPTGTTFVPGSLTINGVAKTDGAGDDEAEFDGSSVVFRVGTGANASQGGQVNINDTVTMTFDVTVTAVAGELVCNQASIDYQGATSGNAGSGVSDDPNTPAVDDCTEITTTASAAKDYGDAPAATYGDASHTVPTTPNLYIGGVGPDTESNTHTSPNADGDDNDGTDEEDGLTIHGVQLTQGDAVRLTVPVYNDTGSDATLSGWIDFDGSGTFEPTEKATVTVPNGLHLDGEDESVLLDFGTPTMAAGTTYVRLRVSSAGGDDATGTAADGEVEDHLVEIVPGLPTTVCPVETVLDFNQLNESPAWDGTQVTRTGTFNGINYTLVFSDSGTLVWNSDAPEISSNGDVELSFNADSDQDAWVEMDLAADTLIDELSLTIYDLDTGGDYFELPPTGDSSGMGWVDNVRIEGFNGATPVPASLVGGSMVRIDGNDAFANGFTSSIEPRTEPSTQVKALFSGPVDRVVIRYFSQDLEGRLETEPNSQFVWIEPVLTGCPVSSSPDVVLVKRITAINGLTTNPNDSKDLTQVINDGVADSADDESNWPASYLVGELDAGLVQPGDEIEYTVYFMNAGDGAAETVRICDWIQPNQSFVTGKYGGNDIELVIDGTTYNLTDDSDAATVDRGEVTTVGSLPATPTCNLSSFTTTATDEVVVVDITGTTGDPAGLATFPNTTGQGTPNNAYGYFRFTTKVDE